MLSLKIWKSSHCCANAQGRSLQLLPASAKGWQTALGSCMHLDGEALQWGNFEVDNRRRSQKKWGCEDYFVFLSLSFLCIIFTEGPPSYSISIWVCFFYKKKMSFSIEKFKILPKFCLNWNTFSYINTEVKKMLRFLIIQYSLSMIYYI